MYEYDAKVTRVVDGDTVEVQLDLGFKVYHRAVLRLDGIDTPELNQEGGVAARDFLRNLLSDEDVTVRTRHVRTFARYVATVSLADGTDVNDALVEAGHAKRVTIAPA